MLSRWSRGYSRDDKLAESLHQDSGGGQRMPEEFDVFLSHNSQDKAAVEEIATHLRDRGLRVWLDKDELRPGLPWQKGLAEGVRVSRSVAVFVGEDGLGPWQEPEMEAFLVRAKREGIPVIPVLLPGCPDSPQLTLFLEAMTWVDLREGLTDDGLVRLAWGITGTKGARGTSGRRVRFSLPKTPRARWSWAVALFLLGVLLTLAAWLWLRPPEIYAVRVQVVDPQGRPVRGSTIRASAGNEPHLLPDGWWQVEIPEGKVPTDGRISLWADHEEWEGNRVDLRLGADPNVQVEIRLKQPETWVRGLVVDENGRGLANVRVSRQDGTRGEVMTDSAGRFALRLSDPPETRIRLRAERGGVVSEGAFCFVGRDTCSITLAKL